MDFTGTETRVSSWEELVRELHRSEIVPRREDEGGHLRSPYVFRGMGVCSWRLETALERLPGFLSGKCTTVERALIRSFRKYSKAGSFDDKSEWHILAVAQHNGLPTRCLDWTASPLVAVHFACSNEAHKDKDGAIWCLHAGILRDITTANQPSTQVLSRTAWVYDTRLLEKQYPDLDALDHTYDSNEPSSKIMLLWEPPSLDDRIANQSGLFTLMNSGSQSQHSFLVDHAAKSPLLMHRVVIAASAKPEIRAMLDQNNISERTLFPGLPGLCEWLKRYYSTAW